MSFAAGTGSMVAFQLEYFTSASNTTQRVYHLRAGPDTGLIYTNGLAAGRQFGGVAGITFTVEEMQP